MAKSSVARRKGARHTMTPKRRAQLKRAQAISARKRRLAPNKRKPTSVGRRAGGVKPKAIHTTKVTKRGISKKHIALGIGVAAVAAGGLYAAKRHQNISHYKKERSLIRKHRKQYLPPTLTVYHQTYRQGHRRIQAEQHFRHLGRHHDKQDPNLVWGYTTPGNRRDLELNYGEYAVKVRRVSRRDVETFAPGYGFGGGAKGHARPGWIGVRRSGLQGKKIEHHFAPRANPVHGTSANRARAARVRTARTMLGRARFAVSGKGIASLIR